MRQGIRTVGLPQERLGMPVGINQHSASARISRYAYGINEPFIATAQKMADAQEAPLPFLLLQK
jgi:hypothetical protein